MAKVRIHHPILSSLLLLSSSRPLHLLVLLRFPLRRLLLEYLILALYFHRPRRFRGSQSPVLAFFGLIVASVEPCGQLGSSLQFCSDAFIVLHFLGR